MGDGDAGAGIESTTIVELFGGREVSPVPDPFSVYRRLRREQPVIQLEGTGYEAYLITRHADVLATILDDRTYSNRANAQGIGLVIGRTIVEMDGDEHHRYRALITPSMAPRSLRGEFQETVRSIAHELIDGFAGTGRVDLVEAFTFTYPLRVFTRILGLPVDDYAEVHQWAIDLTRVAMDPMAGLQASKRLARYFRPILEERLQRPANDLISQLAHAEVEGQRLTEDEVVSFLRLLVIAGAETTYHLIGSALYALLTNPEQLAELRADRSLLRPVLDEALRWESPVQMTWRLTVEDVEIAGHRIPANSQLLVSFGSANRDETVFADPDRFDLHRDATEHLAFGQGRHFCAGSRLAYAEAEAALEAILDRLPNLRLAPDHEGGVVGLAFRGPERLLVEFDPA